MITFPDLYVAGFSAAFGIGGVRAGSLAPLCGLHAAHNAMEFLWFPRESNATTTWPMAALTVGALSLWLVWLFWMTSPRHIKPARTHEGFQTANVI